MVKLKGENRIDMFRHVAERLVSKIASFDGVCGIILLGGLVRGFADRFSDLDMTVFISKNNERLKKHIYKVPEPPAFCFTLEILRTFDNVIEALGSLG